MHYKRDEILKLGQNFKDYKLFVHDSTNTYRVTKPSLDAGNIKGTLIQLEDSAKIAEIRNPKTRKQMRDHKNDLNVYSKTEIKDNGGFVLKKEDIKKISRIVPIKPKFDAVLYAEILGVVALGTVIWIGVIASFGGLL